MSRSAPGTKGGRKAPSSTAGVIRVVEGAGGRPSKKWVNAAGAEAAGRMHRLNAVEAPQVRRVLRVREIQRTRARHVRRWEPERPFLSAFLPRHATTMHTPTFARAMPFTPPLRTGALGPDQTGLPARCCVDGPHPLARAAAAQGAGPPRPHRGAACLHVDAAAAQQGLPQGGLGCGGWSRECRVGAR
jgi:hypothetical protein